MNDHEEGNKFTVQGFGCPVHAVIESVQANSLPTISSDRNITAVRNMAVVTYNDTRNSGSSSENPRKQNTSPYRAFDAISKNTVEESAAKQSESFELSTGVIANNPKKISKITAKTNKKALKKTSNSSITVAVIDKSNEDGAISIENWKKVQVALSSVFLPILKENPGPVPSYKDGGWYQRRVKLMVCADLRSLDLYKIAISKIGVIWDEAKIEVVSIEDIPNIASNTQHIPRSKQKPPWWTNEIGKLRKVSRKLFNRAKYTRADSDWNSYKESIKVYKTQIRKAQRRSSNILN